MSLTIDLHHHVIPDFYWEVSNEDGNAAGGINPPRWSLDGAIAYLDEARIDVALPSISTPGVHFGDDAAARDLARRVSEYLADIRRDRPDRFGAFAVLPLPDVEGSLDQIAYAFDVLELDGVSVYHQRRRQLSGRQPLRSDLRGAAAPPQSCSSIRRHRPIRSRTRSASRTRSSTTPSTRRERLRSSTTATRSPERQTSNTCSSHAGGTIPFLASRFAIVDEMDVIPGAQERGTFADALPRLYWDTASAFSDPVLHMLRSVTGLGNAVFGTDYPYPRDAISIAGLRQLQNTAELDDAERRGVLGESAGRLIPRLAQVASTL